MVKLLQDLFNEADQDDSGQLVPRHHTLTQLITSCTGSSGAHKSVEEGPA